MSLFKKTYDGESIVDLGRDISEVFEDGFNPKIQIIPKDEHGFMQGEFLVTVQWAREGFPKAQEDFESTVQELRARLVHFGTVIGTATVLEYVERLEALLGESNE